MTRITYTDIEKLTDGKDRTMGRMIERTCLAINQTEDSLASKLRYMAGTMDRVQRALAAGQGMNSLGEFQRQPAEIDQLIAARAIHWQNLGSLIGDEAANALATRQGVTADA